MRTVFHVCPNHQGWFAGEARSRKAETFAEGGPAYGPPCTSGDACKVRPGVDHFTADICEQTAWYDTSTGQHPFRWPVNGTRP